MSRLLDLSGRRFIVTDGTQGLGEATALDLAPRGAAGVTLMRKSGQGGSIVNILSQSAHGGQPAQMMTGSVVYFDQDVIGAYD